ncbi:MAG: ATP-binding cassette domain-containing protein, partial [Patescibacteria group bacterium]
MNNSLSIKNLNAGLKDLGSRDKEILKGVDFKMEKGSIQAIMGPNGSGKSTLAQVIMGDPTYSINSGKIEFLNKDITTLSVTKKALMGLFLSFQHPVEVPGVNVGTF